MHYRRALGIKVIGNLFKEFYEKGYQTYEQGPGWMIIMSYEEGRRCKQLGKKIIQINTDKWSCCPETVLEACRLLKHQHQHQLVERKN